MVGSQVLMSGWQDVFNQAMQPVLKVSVCLLESNEAPTGEATTTPLKDGRLMISTD